MTDPLISEYLPVLRGHIINKYAWMEKRGNCLITVNDLMQIASIALVKLVEKWDGLLDYTPDDEGAVFWRFLEADVKHAVLRYFKQTAHGDRKANSSVDHISDHPEAYPDDVRTSLWRFQQPSIVQQDIVDFFTLMPRRDKILIALRYFDEITFDVIADLIGKDKNTTWDLVSIAVKRWRVYARNQFTTTQEDVPYRPERGWEPSDALLDYLQSRHQKDIHEYLGYVTICFRADVAYLVDILSTAPTFVPGTYQTLSPYMQQQIDKMIGDGENLMEVSRILGLTYGVVRGHAKRRRASV